MYKFGWLKVQPYFEEELSKYSIPKFGPVWMNSVLTKTTDMLCWAGNADRKKEITEKLQECLPPRNI